MTISEALRAYVAAATPARDALVERLERQARDGGVPITGPDEAALLHAVARLVRPDLMVELGTATGYSAIWLLRGWPAARLVTFELDAGRAGAARRNLAAAGLTERADVREENAVEGLAGLEPGSAALVFNDLLCGLRDEERVEQCFAAALRVLAPGGLLLTDNALVAGEVVQPRSLQARCVHRWNQLVTAEPSLSGTILPVGDGLGVAVRDWQPPASG